MTLTLDHVAVVVPDLETARRSYERLGFLLTPASSHRGRNAAGEIEPWGSGNHCAMFRRGYFEILGVTDPARRHDHVLARLEKYTGLHLIALGCEDVEAVSRAWAARGVPVQPVSYLGRDVPQVGGGTRPGAFGILHIEDEGFPEAELFAIHHETPEVLWQEDLLVHPNGVEALLETAIVSAEPEQTRARLDRFGLPSGAPGIRVLTPAEAELRYGGVAPPRIPCVLAATFGVSDLPATAAFLRRCGVTVETVDGRLRVPAAEAEGCVLEFVEHR